jgi:heme oxygenase (mycobilin-producing)
MITRIFRAKVPTDLHKEFEEKFISISIPYVQSKQGFVSVVVGRPTQWQPDEFVMISVWDSEDDLIAFAGKDWNKAVIPKEMKKYVSVCWVHHYENFG